MNERVSLDQDQALQNILLRKISPDDAMIADNVGEYLVIFNIPIEAPHVIAKREQITVRFLNREARDKWWQHYKRRFKEVWT